MFHRAPVAVIALAQLFGTSLWFSANSAADDLALAWGIDAGGVGALTAAVQLGFIAGTLFFALSGLADRFAASRIFAISAVLGALCNGVFALLANGLGSGLPLRFLVGVSLAGIYPLGMKLVVGWVPERAGSALAWLVGMLTLGTALPHGIRYLGSALPWPAVVGASSLLALLAAAMVLRLGDGPHLPPARAGARLHWGKVAEAFSIPAFRASALGYFGHQWELYAMWTLVPMLLVVAGIAPAGSATLSALAFAVVALGGLACVLGGYWSRRIGSARVAAWALAGSAACCAVFPLLVDGPRWLLLLVMLFWGFCVVADSPHFSALSARACPPAMVGSALAFQTAIGFAVTLPAIHLGTALVETMGAGVAWLLLPGPLLGLLGLAPLWRRSERRAASAP